MKKSIALLIACENYNSGIENLKGPINDLISMSEIFENCCGLEREDIFLIFEGQTAYKNPGRQEILKAIVDIADKYRDEDIEKVFFYFSGHGFQSADDKEIYLVPGDAIPEKIEYSSLKYGEVCNLMLDAFEPEIVLCFLDACRLEHQTKGFCEEDSVKLEKGVALFASCMPGHASYIIPDKEMSAFTYCMKEAFEKGGCCLVSELDIYLKNNLPVICKNYNFPDIQRPVTCLADTSQRNMYLVVHSKDIKFEQLLERMCTEEELDDVREYSETIQSHEASHYTDYALQTQERARIIRMEEGDKALREYRQLYDDLVSFVNSVKGNVKSFDRDIQRCKQGHRPEFLYSDAKSVKKITAQCETEKDFIKKTFQAEKELEERQGAHIKASEACREKICDIQRVLLRYWKAAKLFLDTHPSAGEKLVERIDAIEKEIYNLQGLAEHLEMNNKRMDMFGAGIREITGDMKDFEAIVQRYANATTVHKQNFFERIHKRCIDSVHDLETIGKEIEETESKSDEK